VTTNQTRGAQRKVEEGCAYFFVLSYHKITSASGDKAVCPVSFFLKKKTVLNDLLCSGAQHDTHTQFTTNINSDPPTPISSCLHCWKPPSQA
jgi:hypothetical protein